MGVGIVIVHTGWWWLDVLVCVVSGGAFLRICFLLPTYYRDVVKPQVEILTEHLAERLAEHQRQHDDDEQND